MITIKPFHKDEPAPYIAYKRIVQNPKNQNEYTIEWHDRNGLIRSRKMKTLSLARLKASAEWEAREFKNPEYFKLTNRLKMAYTRTARKLDHLTRGIRIWLGWLPRR